MFHRLLYNDFLATLYVDCSRLWIADFAARQVVKCFSTVVAIGHDVLYTGIIVRIVCKHSFLHIEVYLAVEKHRFIYGAQNEAFDVEVGRF